MGEILLGNLGDTPLLATFRMSHLHAYGTMVWSFVGGAVALTALAGLVAAYRIGNFVKAAFSSVCSGLVSGFIVLAGLLAMELVFHNVLRQSPSVLSEFATSGQADLSLFMYGDAVAGIAHVLIGPTSGITVGAVGAANADALAAFGRLRKQAEAFGFGAPEHFVFPACERQRFDPTRPQKTWRTAWRSLVDEAGKQAGEKAAKRAAKAGTDPEEARARAIAAFVNEKGVRLRFHDLRHQAITELAENGASDATVMALAGHMSREMMEHYSHVRMAAKREALEKLSHGLITAPEAEMEPASDAVQ